METVVTSAMLQPILESIQSNVAVILPIGVGIMGTMLGIKIIPRIFHMFF